MMRGWKGESERERDTKIHRVLKKFIFSRTHSVDFRSEKPACVLKIRNSASLHRNISQKTSLINVNASSLCILKSHIRRWHLYEHFSFHNSFRVSFFRYCECVPDPLFMCNNGTNSPTHKNRNILWDSHKFRVYFGLPRETVIGALVLDFSHVFVF